MTLFVASIILGILPMAIYALIVWRLDRWEKEPFPLMLAAFVWGFVPSAIFALISQGILGMPVDAGGEPTLAGELYKASVLAPVTEELIKGLGVWLLMWIFHREVDSILDGMIYGSMVGFGFSAIENILYFSGQPDPASLAALFFLRAFIFGLLHAMFTGLTGIGFALGKFSKFQPFRFVWPLLGLSAAIITHALHNYFATIGGESLLYAVSGSILGVTFFLLLIAVCLFHENRWIQIQLSPEVENGVILADQALDASSFWKRTSLSIFTYGPKVYRQRHKLLHNATRLAYKKQQAEKMGETSDLLATIETLRESVRKLSKADPFYISGLIAAGRKLPPPLPPKRIMPPPLPRS